MRAFRMFGLNEGRLTDTPEPTLLPGDVLVEPEAAGVCGTDLHVFHEGVFVDFDNGLPVTMGHEVVGRVLGFGPGVTEESSGLHVGDRVVAEPVLNCGHCEMCLRGMPNLCIQWSHLGFLRDGVWADRVAIPSSRLTRISAEIPAIHAVLAEPLACALHFLARGDMQAGKHVLVLGGGPAGQLTALAARAAGAASVVLSDPQETRRTLAVAAGADAALDPTREDIAAVMADVTQGHGADLVVEIAGTPPAVNQAFTSPRRGGTLVLAGICGAKEISVDTNRIVNDEITVRGAFATRWQMGAAAELLGRQTVDVSRIVTETMQLEEALVAMDRMKSDPSICKIVLTF